MTRDEKRLYLVGQLLAGGAHRSPSQVGAVGMATRALEIAEGVLASMDALDEKRHDTIPAPAPEAEGFNPFFGTFPEASNGEASRDA